MLEIGSVVDSKYKILSKIGQGGMSVVYMAINEKANKTWAVKEVRKDGIKDFEVVKQGLIVETDMLKKLSHPNLPSIVDVIEDNEMFIIVMDYIEGNTLNKALEEYGAQPQEYVIEWAKQLCDVLGYLHSRTPAIIYRDMKPSNVMLKPNGNLMLIDFGTAREFKERNLADTTCLGTVGYAAPEQFGGKGQTDARTDIYCLGATLYHLVTGQNPCEPPYEIRPIRELNPSLSSGLEKIIAKCTQRNPDDRYQSCAELLYALEHYEEIDELYRRKQKKRLVTFASTAVLCLAFGITGLFSNSMAMRTEEGNYSATIEAAEKESNNEKKVDLYIDAISIRPQQATAYIALMDTFKKTGDAFDIEEEGLLKKAILNNREKIKLDATQYAKICFEIGKLYWYYYDYGNTSDNKLTRMKSAAAWFDEALKYGGDGFEQKAMATVYRDIGMFYSNITINTVEANENGLYKPLWENFKQLITSIQKESNSNEIVRLELYELVRSALHQYANKFKADGVEQKEMLEILGSVSKNVSSVNATTDKTKSIKSATEGLMSDTYDAINLAFQGE